MATRQIRWNVRSESEPERHEYLLLIINDAREKERIIQKLMEQLAPTNDMKIVTEGRIDRIPYELISFTSPHPKSRISWSKVYRGKSVRDNNLYQRRHPDDLENYIIEHIAQLSR